MSLSRAGLPLTVALTLLGCGAAPPAASVAPSEAHGSKPADEPAGAAGDFRLEQTVELLGGSARVRVPSSAEAKARPHVIMAAAAPVEEETRVILVPGDERARFVLLATESFVRGTGEPERDAAIWLGDELSELDVQRVAVGRGLVGVALEPRRARLAEDRPLYVLGAMIERADHTIFELAFYVLPEMSSEREIWQARARAIVESVSAGSTNPALERVHRVSTGGGEQLSLELPRPAVMTRQDGPDFTVYHFREIPNVGEEAGTVGIYFGGYPAYQHEQVEATTSVTRSPGRLLGQRVEWHDWELRAGREMSEAMATVGGHTRIHVFIGGPKNRMGSLRAAVEKMHPVAAP